MHTPTWLLGDDSSGDPLAIIVYVVIGASDVKSQIPLSTMTVEAFAIAPSFRGGGRSRTLLAELINSCFTVTQPDLLIYEYVDTPEMNAHRDDRSFTESTPGVGKHGRNRTRVVFSRADYDARMIDRADEATIQTSFTQLI